MKRFLTLFTAIFLALSLSAQCKLKNTAFGNSETLVYNLYFNWNFVWLKAGTATMLTSASSYKGQPAYRGSLTTRGNSKADEYFVMRDTLMCYTTRDLVPLYFRKGAKEGKRYTVDEVFYSYSGGKPTCKHHRKHSKGTHDWMTKTYNECVYDMLSIFLRARSFDPTNWQKGKVISFPVVDGNSKNPAQLRYQGKTTIKADNGKKYRCLQLSYFEQTKGKMKEIVRFYVTDDKNHIPIRLDMFLKVGAGKAFLVSMKGQNNPVTAEVK